MTNKIAKRLKLEPIDHIHQIEDIRSEREIHMAKFIRNTQGKHVMPIPYRQVEQNFLSDLFKEALRSFQKIVKSWERRQLFSPIFTSK